MNSTSLHQSVTHSSDALMIRQAVLGPESHSGPESRSTFTKISVNNTQALSASSRFLRTCDAIGECHFIVMHVSPRSTTVAIMTRESVAWPSAWPSAQLHMDVACVGQEGRLVLLRKQVEGRTKSLTTDGHLRQESRQNPLRDPVSVHVVLANLYGSLFTMVEVGRLAVSGSAHIGHIPEQNTPCEKRTQRGSRMCPNSNCGTNSTRLLDCERSLAIMA